MRVTVQPETKRKHISESDRYCTNELVSFVPRANILKTDSFLTATIWTNDRNQPRCINVVCCVAYLRLTAHSAHRKPLCLRARVCVFVTHTTYCLVSWSNPQTLPTHSVPIERSVARILHSHLPCTRAHTHANSPLDLLPHSEDVKDSFPLP